MAGGPAEQSIPALVQQTVWMDWNVCDILSAQLAGGGGGVTGECVTCPEISPLHGMPAWSMHVCKHSDRWTGSLQNRWPSGKLWSLSACEQIVAAVVSTQPGGGEIVFGGGGGGGPGAQMWLTMRPGHRLQRPPTQPSRHAHV